MFNLARKNHLAMNLNKLRKAYPDHFGFFPQTWILPADKSDLVAQFKDKKPKTFILKPQASCQGRGIMLVRYPEQIPDGEAMVAQRYVLKPYLLEGLKFDLRIYFLVAGCDPLRLFVFKEGMARLATHEYVAPDKSNMSNMFMHLTNYAINKFNKEFQENDGEDKGSGHKRLMSWVFDHMKEQGVDTDKLWNEIKLLGLKTLCVAQPQLAHHYKSGQSDDFHNHMCFEILGFDVLIDSQSRPVLIEVNHTPSFATESKLDFDLKKNVIHDAINLMHMTGPFKTKLINQKKKETDLRIITGKRVKLTLEDREERKRDCQFARDKYIRKHLGGYEEIYPFPPGKVETEPYSEFMEFAKTEYEIQTGASKRVVKKEEPVTKPAFGSRVAVENKILKPKKDPTPLSKASKSTTLEGKDFNKSKTLVPNLQPNEITEQKIKSLIKKTEEKNKSSQQALEGMVSRPGLKIRSSTLVQEVATISTSLVNPVRQPVRSYTHAPEITTSISRANTLDQTPQTNPSKDSFKGQIDSKEAEALDEQRGQRAFKIQTQKGTRFQPVDARYATLVESQTSHLRGQDGSLVYKSMAPSEYNERAKPMVSRRPVSSEYLVKNARRANGEKIVEDIGRNNTSEIRRFQDANMIYKVGNYPEDPYNNWPQQYGKVSDSKQAKIPPFRMGYNQEKIDEAEKVRRYYSKDTKYMARRYQLPNTKAELTLGPPTVVVGLGLSIAGYQLPFKK